MSESLSKKTCELIEIFHGKALEAKTHAELGTSTMNELYEGLMSEFIKLERRLKAVIADRDEEISEQLNLIFALRQSIDGSR